MRCHHIAPLEANQKAQQRITIKCSRVADRAFPEFKIFSWQPVDFGRYPTNSSIQFTKGRDTMTMSSRPLVGPGRFQWNAGGWFGSSLGSSAWMIVTSYLLVFHNQPSLGLVPAVGFAIVLFASLLLWARRDRIYPFPAMMGLLGLLAVAIPLVWIVVSSNGSPAALAAMNWPASTWPTVLVCAIAPALMIWFLVLERSVTTKPDTTKPESKIVA
jgi:hypothetical protein